MRWGLKFGKGQGQLVVPVATAASSVLDDGFTANWDPVPGAYLYRLDVSTDPDFGTFVSGYSNKKIFSLSHTLSGLLMDHYYYRVRAQRVLNISENSNVIEVEVGVPGIYLAGTLSAFHADLNEASAPQSYGVMGYELTGSISVGAVAGYEYSVDNDTWAGTLTLPPTYNGLVYVRLAANAVEGTYSGTIAHSSAGVASVNMAVTGEVSDYTKILYDETDWVAYNALDALAF